MKHWLADVRFAFPDVWFIIEDLFADNDKTILRWSSEASRQRAFLTGTGKKVVCRGVNISRFVDGKIAEEWGEWDALRLLERTGGISE